MIAFVGSDGSGKSTLARMARDGLKCRGRRVALVWSRWNNWTSKPLLAMARLTGHSWAETTRGYRFRYHDFDRSFFYRHVFTALQALDVHLATRARLVGVAREADVVLFERGPWDTVADVMLDTGIDLAGTALERFMTASVRSGRVIHVTREPARILESRPDLVFDRKFARKLETYEHLARVHAWERLENDGPLDEVAVVVEALLASRAS